ncbi:hypothetical protein GLOTRDRAFT_110389 [Gloeophyllum trabeum ATCC 11539]|uniref:Pali-domain-containing protein n=1 Tax=Gloeophyllum trabeum (strain ATCC 11539 / FP-39264 / Madison 617) TaxID=670483 RepID=S7RUY9_GLOTA|nr:uncharacterized protein GLOTRDRAFT_110389 [Gloeophyllum trabeum ATCC 11539]EPQ57014.1 hypothetical protein GLOTRDRAFT_110389 [Gloeophyllum trabeum ATCC 11539]
MRKTSYVVTFFAVLISLAFTLFSAYLPDWLEETGPDLPYTKATIRYGLLEVCERQKVQIPGPDGSKIDYTRYECRPWPARVTDKCETENKTLCVEWTSAGYFVELSIGFAVTALLAIVFGVSTHSRRRRIWRAVAGLVAVHAILQIVAFALITDAYRKSRYAGFEHARPSTAYVLNMVDWLLSIFIVFGVVTTGISADAGHRWAAGNRAYQPIRGGE